MSVFVSILIAIVIVAVSALMMRWAAAVTLIAVSHLLSGTARVISRAVETGVMLVGVIAIAAGLPVLVSALPAVAITAATVAEPGCVHASIAVVSIPIPM